MAHALPNLPVANWRLALGTLLVWLSISLPASAQWSWKLPNSSFQELNVYERQQYAKAEKLFADRKYAEAVAEFEKFATQFPESTVLSAAVFMKAYSLKEDLRRGQAIKIFQQVVDYFPDDQNCAGASLYLIGQCYLANADTKEGLKAMQTMVAHKDYRTHPLAANALSELAENYRKSNELPKAHQFWRQMYTDFYATNRQQADVARDNSVRYYLFDKRFEKIEELVAIHNFKDPRTNAGYYNYIYDRANEVIGGWFPKGKEKEQDELARYFYTYFTHARPLYEEKAKWDYLRRTLEFSLRFFGGEEKLWRPIVEEMLTIANSDDAIRYLMNTLLGNGKFDVALAMTDKIKNKDAFYPWLFDRLLQLGRYDHAEYILDRISDTALRRWKEYELAARRVQWKKCVEILTGIMAGDQARSRQAMKTLADIYRDRTRQYDEALKFYAMIDEPPGTAFAIAYTYQLKGDSKRSAETYTEVENFFPDQAAEAAWRRGEMYRGFKMQEQAVAEYRRILKVYPKSGQSSRAHQRLEDYGIATGGGVIEK